MKGTFIIMCAAFLAVAALFLATVPAAAVDGATADTNGGVCTAHYQKSSIITDGYLSEAEWSGAEEILFDATGVGVTMYIIFNSVNLYIGASISDGTEDPNERFDICIDLISDVNSDAPGIEDIKLNIPRGSDAKCLVGNGEYWVLSSERIYSTGRTSTGTGWAIEAAVPLDRLEVSPVGASEYRMMVLVDDTASGYGAWPDSGVTTQLDSWGRLIIDMDDMTYYSGTSLQEEDLESSGLYGIQSAIIFVTLAFLAAVVIVFTYHRTK